MHDALKAFIDQRLPLEKTGDYRDAAAEHLREAVEVDNDNSRSTYCFQLALQSALGALRTRLNDHSDSEASSEDELNYLMETIARDARNAVGEEAPDNFQVAVEAQLERVKEKFKLTDAALDNEFIVLAGLALAWAAKLS